MQRLVTWVQGFALALGGPGLFLIALLDSSFLSFPEVVDLLIILFVTRHKERMIYYALLATLGSMAGCFMLYLLGRKGGEAFLRRRFHERHVDRALAVFHRQGCPLFRRRAARTLVRRTGGRIPEEQRARGVARPRRRGAGRRFRMDLVSQAPTAASELTNSHEDPYNQPFIPTRSMGPEISVVVPMRNESPNVAELHAGLSAVLDAFGRPYEILVIDDGSTDDTFAKLAALQRRNPRLRVIRFRRNFGQTAAFAAGFARARGRYIVTFDGDLQNDPTDIPAMIEKIAEGPDIVAGWRKERKDAFLNRRLPSMIANTVISFATGVKLHDYGCSLKVFRAEVVKSMKLYGEMHRFLPAIAAEQGVDIV